MPRPEFLEPEAKSSDAKLDKFAFADNRTDVPYEKDNARERKLYDSLLGVFIANDSLKKQDVDDIKKFLATGTYSSVFHEPASPVVYRGMSVPEKWVLKALGEKSMNDVVSKYNVKNLRKGVEITADFEFEPRNGRYSSSWSESEIAASGFAGAYPGYEVVMEASVSDNPHAFVACVNGLYRVKGFSKYPEEEEVIGLGKIKVRSLRFRKSLINLDDDELNDKRDRKVPFLLQE